MPLNDLPESPMVFRHPESGLLLCVNFSQDIVQTYRAGFNGPEDISGVVRARTAAGQLVESLFFENEKIIACLVIDDCGEGVRLEAVDAGDTWD